MADLWTAKQAAEALKCTCNNVRLLARRGVLPVAGWRESTCNGIQMPLFEPAAAYAAYAARGRAGRPKTKPPDVGPVPQGESRWPAEAGGWRAGDRVRTADGLGVVLGAIVGPNTGTVYLDVRVGGAAAVWLADEVTREGGQCD